MRVALSPAERDAIRQVCMSAPRKSPWIERTAVVLRAGVVGATDGYRATLAEVPALRDWITPIAVPAAAARKAIDAPNDVALYLDTPSDSTGLIRVVRDDVDDVLIEWADAAPRDGWVRQVLPWLTQRRDWAKDQGTGFTVDRAVLRRVLQKAKKNRTSDAKGPLHVHLGAGVSFGWVDGERFPLEEQSSSRTGELTVDVRLLDGVLAASKTAAVRVYLYDDRNPLVIEAGDLTHLVQPVREDVRPGRTEAA